DACDDLTILMLADQYVGPCSTITGRDHELLRVPKCEDDVLALTVQCIHLLMALRIYPHRPPQSSNHRCADRREQRELQPGLDSLQGRTTHPSRPGTASHGAACTVPHGEAARHASPLQQSSPGPGP